MVPKSLLYKRLMGWRSDRNLHALGDAVHDGRGGRRVGDVPGRNNLAVVLHDEGVHEEGAHHGEEAHEEGALRDEEVHGEGVLRDEEAHEEGAHHGEEAHEEGVLRGGEVHEEGALHDEEVHEEVRVVLHG